MTLINSQLNLCLINIIMNKTDTVCGDRQCCDGKVLETHLTDDANQCLEKCQDLSTCMWFTFRTTTYDCLLQVTLHNQTICHDWLSQ